MRLFNQLKRDALRLQDIAKDMKNVALAYNYSYMLTEVKAKTEGMIETADHLFNFAIDTSFALENFYDLDADDVDFAEYLINEFNELKHHLNEMEQQSLYEEGENCDKLQHDMKYLILDSQFLRQEVIKDLQTALKLVQRRAA